MGDPVTFSREPFTCHHEGDTPRTDNICAVEQTSLTCLSLTTDEVKYKPGEVRRISCFRAATPMDRSLIPNHSATSRVVMVGEVGRSTSSPSPGSAKNPSGVRSPSANS